MFHIPMFNNNETAKKKKSNFLLKLRVEILFFLFSKQLNSYYLKSVSLSFMRGYLCLTLIEAYFFSSSIFSIHFK